MLCGEHRRGLRQVQPDGNRQLELGQKRTFQAIRGKVNTLDKCALIASFPELSLRAHNLLESQREWHQVLRVECREA
jgi:hypothetical protein